MKVVFCVAMLLVGIGGFIFLADNSAIRFGQHAEPEAPTSGLLVVGYLFTLLGVFLGSAFRELLRLRSNGEHALKNPLAFLASVFRLFDFWMGLFASPLVYALMVNNLGGGGQVGLVSLAIQNGFCCTIIAQEVLGQGKPAPREVP